ncbi:EAL domain-containing protein [Enterovibrio makurazakiensis]|uniref:EAL domain-containing protein n=1 Tax=Enterovibrio makurazakiensis TaxID=2910232 RepID=UPI003D1B1A33
MSKLSVDHHAKDFGQFYLQILGRKADVLSAQVGVALSQPEKCEEIDSRMAMWRYIDDYATVKDGDILCQSNPLIDWGSSKFSAKTLEPGLHHYLKKSSDSTADIVLMIVTEKTSSGQGFAVLTEQAFHEYLDLVPSSRYSKLTIWIGDTAIVGRRHADQVIANSVESGDHHISIGALASDTYVNTTMAMFVLSSIPVALMISLMAHFLICYFAPRLSLADDIKRGLDRKEFYLQYQPIYGNDNKLHGFEALARWQHPKMGNVSPEIFIPEIENQQLSMLFTRYVFERVVQDIGPLNLTKPYHLGVNVPPSFMCSDELDTTLKSTLEAFQRVNLLLTLEVTERQLLDEEAIRHIDAVRQLGIRVAIDDFGVGHTSLSMLQRVHFDYLKIDKCFVDTVGVDSINAPVLESIIELAHRLNVNIVAEGVEKIEQSSFLSARGCQFQQGYLHDRPLSIETISSRFVFG